MTSHLFDSLQSAASLAVHQEGYDFSAIIVERWAQTYRTSEDNVRDAFRIAENGSRKLPEEVAAQALPIIRSEGDEE